WYNSSMNSKAESVNSFLSSTKTHIKILQERIPLLASFLEVADNDRVESSYKLLEQIPLQIFEACDRPLIVVAFCGPSGAGKSTVFNMLTGLNVPAGGAVRPMTHVSFAAFPGQIIDMVSADEVFKGFELSRLADIADLKTPGSAAKKLLYTTYKSSDLSDSLWPCLVDIPDFNTTELSNWEKAEEMIKRADSIIFTVYPDAYKDQKTFEILKKVLQVAGNVTWLLTKLDPAESARYATEIHADLIKCVQNRPDFQTLRSDGQTLADFLAASAFFYSPFSGSATLSDIQPLANSNQDFVTHIFCQKGLEVSLKRQLQSIKSGVSSCETVCLRAYQSHLHLKKVIDSCDELLEKAAQTITGEEFPVFRILELIRHQLEQNRPSFLRRAFQPLLLIGSGLKTALNSIRNAISGFRGIDLASSLRQRDQLERSRLQNETTNLIELWRRKPELTGLITEKCEEATSAVLTAELPPVDSEWEASVNESLKLWQQGNKDLWRWMNIVDELFILLGTGLVVADFFIDGGVGTMGVVAVVGGSSAAGGLLLSLFNNMGLSREVMEAHRSWKTLRRASYKEHLREKLAGPLFLNDFRQKAMGLAPETIESCQQACEQLKEICRIHEIK
ncbi:MAG: ATP-binding cassette domain-containing protein, partial [Candidatus Riflebacteria bacterium]|nr:ATP-binding cassette domain-containing protein [Candidatus Riflebacteria bacterium]